MSQQKVPRRTWGKTGLSIPVIPFGTQGFGDKFGPVTEDEACDLIRHAVDRGVNHFDCARCYGNSIHKLGVAIKQGVVRRDEVIISARVCCHSAAEWGGYGEGRADYSKDRVLADLEDQRDILGIERFDVVFIHDPDEIEPTLESGGTLEGLEEARSRDWVDFIGFGMKPHDFHLAVIDSGRTDALLTFNDFNLLRQTSAEDLIPAAAEKGLGVINGWSIMRGWLTGTPVENFIPREKWGEDHHRAEAIRAWCEERDINLLSLALQFCLREDRVHGNPIGSLNKAQLDANIEATLTTIDDQTLTEFSEARL